MAVINKIKIGDTTYDVGVNLANATGTLPVANGGTGLTSLVTPTVTWGAGTSAGPTLKIKDSLGQSSSAVAIPAASSSASGIVTTGTQTFKGDKLFAGNLYVHNSTSEPRINFRATNNTSPSGVIYYQGPYIRLESDGVTETVVNQSRFRFLCYSHTAGTAATRGSYYYSYYLPNTPTGLTANKSYYFALSTTTSALGNANQPVYMASGNILTKGNSFVPTTGGTFTGEIYIEGAYYPSFSLLPTSTNPAGTYTKAAFEGSYDDNVSMWIWTDKTNSAKSRRGLVLYGYGKTTDDKQALALRRCDTGGNWLEDLYVMHSGGGILKDSGQITCARTGGMWVFGRDHALIKSTNSTSASSWMPVTSSKTQLGSWEIGVCHPNEEFVFCYVPDASYSKGSNDGTVTGVKIKNNGVLMGAAWNDYAEYREVNTTEPGRVVYEVGDDTLSLSTKRMMPACSIISDTFGFSIGETKKCKTPLAQAGRVLAYPLEDRNSYKPGDAVCSGPNGTVSKMTIEEKVMHPECIVGYVSCVPEYEIWGENNTKVNGRIWIKV